MDNRTAQDICKAFSIFANYEPKCTLYVGHGGEWKICKTPPLDMDSLDEDNLIKLGWKWNDKEEVWDLLK